MSAAPTPEAADATITARSSVPGATMGLVPRGVADVPLVGRGPELATLLSAVREAADSRPTAMLVTGDAGVGKTRLVTELVRRARDDRSLVLIGQCVDLGDSGVPYLPFAEALAPLAARATTSPVLRAWLEGGAPVLEADGRVRRLQLFDAVLAALDAEEGEPPTVLVLEDLHWADSSSRDLLAFLVRRLRSQRLVVVATVRTDDLHRRHPLRPLLAELVRLPAVERVELSPFTREELADYVHVLSGTVPPPDLVERLLDRSEGNAYVAEQLLTSGAALPGSVTEILLQRVDALTGTARAVVRAVAAGGPRVEHDVLAEVTALEPLALDEALRDAVARNVLTASGDGYAFHHALTREAVYDDLLPGERVRLHAAFAHALATREAQGRARAAELAHHRMAAHDLPGALVASLAAAQDARALLAPAEALQHLERALQLWGAVDGPERLSGSTLPRLLLEAASAAGLAGVPARAAAHAEAAVRASGSTREALLGRRALALALLAQDRTRDALAAARELLAAVQSSGCPDDLAEETARAEAVAARALAGLGEVDEAVSIAERALGAAARHGWPDVEADLLTTLAAVRGSAGGPDGAAAVDEVLHRAQQLAHRSGDLGVELRVAYNRAVTTYEAGDVVQALALVEDALLRAEQTGLSWSAYGLELRVLQVIARYAAGDLAGSRRAADLAGHRPSEVVLARVSAAALPAAVARGDDDTPAVVQRLDAAWKHDGQIAMIAGGAGAELRRWHGDAEGALEVVDRALEHVSRVWEPWFLGGIWLSALGLGAAGDLAEAARLTGDAAAQARARDTADRLTARARGTARHGRPRGGAMGPEGEAWLAVCAAERSRVDGRPDPAAWRDALEAFGRAARGVDGYERARCRWRLAEALLADGDRRGAAEEVTLALATARRLGARPLVEALAALVARGRLDVADPDLPRDDLRPASTLTARELQVLGLLAEGLTNRQAGERLYVSDKTVSVHVSNLLAKLGARSRTEAVTLAHRAGLLPEARAAADSVSPRSRART